MPLYSQRADVDRAGFSFKGGGAPVPQKHVTMLAQQLYQERLGVFLVAKSGMYRICLKYA